MQTAAESQWLFVTISGRAARKQDENRSLHLVDRLSLIVAARSAVSTSGAEVRICDRTICHLTQQGSLALQLSALSPSAMMEGIAVQSPDVACGPQRLAG